jgi:hypothetical protein
LRRNDAALIELAAAMRPGEPPESIWPGVKERPLLLHVEGRKPGENFKLLTETPNHIPAAIAVGEVYLAIPNPDDNSVSDFQTTNFDSRLFELSPQHSVGSASGDKFRHRLGYGFSFQHRKER